MLHLCMATIQYDSIPGDAIIDLRISGAYYEKLKIVLLSLTEQVPPDQLLPMMEKFKTPQAPDSALEHNIYTLLLLIKSIEDEAKNQKLTVVKEMVLPDK
jgi:hypothetical protein